MADRETHSSPQNANNDDQRRSSPKEEHDASTSLPPSLVRRAADSARDAAFASYKYLFPPSFAQNGNGGDSASSSMESRGEEIERANIYDRGSGVDDGDEMVRIVSAFDALLREPFVPSCPPAQGRRRTNRAEDSSTPPRPPPARLRSGVTAIRHCRQTETWDCGVACMQMIISWLRDNNKGPVFGKSSELTNEELLEKKWMLDVVATESIWTIDLVTLLERILHEDHAKDATFPFRNYFGRSEVSYLFCTTKFGVDEAYHGLCYYKDAFQCDEVRVKKRFNLAREMGLPAICVSRLSIDRLVDIVSRENCVAIVLLDNRILIQHCNRRKKMDSMEENGESNADAASNDKKSTSKVVARNTMGEYVGSPTGSELMEDKMYQDLPSSDGCASLLVQNVSEKGKETGIASYAGHYVCLTGISFDLDDISEAASNEPDDGSEAASFCMVIKNPASASETDFITPTHFERCWRANGTDEDVIFVVKHKTQSCIKRILSNSR